MKEIKKEIRLIIYMKLMRWAFDVLPKSKEKNKHAVFMIEMFKGMSNDL